MNIRHLAILAIATTPASAFGATTIFSGQDINNSGSPALATNPNSDAAAASFNSALSGTSTESFESFATGTSAPINLSFTGSAGNLDAVLAGSGSVESATRAAPSASGQYAVDGSKYYFLIFDNFTVTFNQDISAFGFYATDLEDLQNINVTINYALGGNTTYNLATIFGSPSGQLLASGSVHFLGFIDTANPFSSIQFGGSSSEFLAFDRMTIGDRAQVVIPPSAVPEPATWAILLLGFGVIGGAMRRRLATAKASRMRLTYA